MTCSGTHPAPAETAATDAVNSACGSGLRGARPRSPHRRLPALLAIAAISAISAIGVSSPAAAKPPLTTTCNSNWMVAAGTSGAGATFEVSFKPRAAARIVPAHGGTDRIWGALWRCVPGGYGAARLTPAQGESVYQQLYCHVKWGYTPFQGGFTWDLEARRPPITWDRIIEFDKANEHKCNW